MLIAALDFISLFAAAASLVLLFIKRKIKPLRKGIKTLLAGLLFFTFIYNLCLFLEWAGISSGLDTLEDYVGALIPMWWAILFYGILQEIAGHDIRQRENKYREKLEELVEDRTAELQKEIAERKKIGDALRQAKESAETANLAKSRFLSSMSHELRTPLNAILGFSRLMTRDPAIPAHQQENLGIINRSGEHLLMLINDVLDMSKIEAGRMVLKPGNVDLHRTLSSIEEMIRSRAEGKGLTFTVDYSGDLNRYIKTDARMLRQVLINLLGNAVKFTKEGNITLRVKAPGTVSPAHEEQPARTIFFQVEDTGPGLSSRELETVFDPFVQGAKGPGNGEGTGLGLAISKQFARLMGGDISVESRVGEGTVFTFSIRAQILPAEPEDPGQSHRRVAALATGTPIFRILIVEDNQSNRTLLRQLLQLVGFKVEEAVNGANAVQSFKTRPPHFIWMDIHMPVMDGYEATRQIRDLPGGRDVKIIALTASAFLIDRQKAMDAGCDDYVRKPFTEEEIFEVMARHLEVSYIYDDTRDRTKTRTTRPDRESKPVPLPEGLRAELYKAAENLDVQHIKSLVQDVGRHDEELARVICAAIEDLDFEELLLILDRRGQGAPP